MAVSVKWLKGVYSLPSLSGGIFNLHPRLHGEMFALVWRLGARYFDLLSQPKVCDSM